MRGRPEGDVRYQVHVGPDGARVVAGADAPADLVLLTDLSTARAARGPDACAGRGSPPARSRCRVAPRSWPGGPGSWPVSTPRLRARARRDHLPRRPVACRAMQPFERLRAIARHGGDDRLLVAEAADCLGEFDDDPAALVVTCRRLLHHHPDRAPLWWLCARAGRADPSEAAWEAEALMRGDATADRLAALLPFPADHPIAVLGWPELSGRTHSPSAPTSRRWRSAPPTTATPEGTTAAGAPASPAATRRRDPSTSPRSSR